jgi:hypothetical protein
MRRMYAVQAPGATDDYVLYDMSVSASENRRHLISRDDPKSAGFLVYPVLRDEESRDNPTLPKRELHSFRSDGFYWLPTAEAYPSGTSTTGS